MADGVFLDTVGLIAVLNKDDEYHDQACAAFAGIGQARRSVVTTNLVLCVSLETAWHVQPVARRWPG